MTTVRLLTSGTELDLAPSTGDDARHAWRLCGLIAVGVAIRFFLALRVGVPSNDGATYLWMTEVMAAGRFSEAVSTIFHPGAAFIAAPFAALCAPLGLSSYQVFAALAALVAGVVAFAMDRSAAALGVSKGGRLVVVMTFVLGFHFVRLPADAYSESFALPLCALAVLATLRSRRCLAAFLAVLAYFVRPEALLYALPALLLARRRPWSVLAVVALGLAGFAALRAALAGASTLTPKLDFMLPLGPLGPLFDGDFVAAWRCLIDNVVRLPAAFASGLDLGFGYVGLVGLVIARATTRAFLVLLAVHVAVLLCFEVKPRFFLMTAPVLLPALGVVWDRAGAWRALTRGVVILLLVVAVVRVGKDFVEPPRRDKVGELAFGRALANTEALDPTRIVISLPRVAWAAGLQPLPPWPWTPQSVKERILRPEHRRIVLHAGQDHEVQVARYLPGFRLVETSPCGRIKLYAR